MNKLIATTAAFAMLAMASSAAAQARSATATATASGTVVRPIAITSTAGLQFNRFVSPAAATTVTIHPMGAFESASDPSGILLVGGTGSAKFTVTGEPSTAFAISLPASSQEMSSGANRMTLNAFTVNQSQMALNVNGDANFSVGATLAVGANQAVGAYTGTFPVTVTYQ